MSDILGDLLELTHLNESLYWLKDWAKKQWEAKSKDVACPDENDFLKYDLETAFRDCPHLRLGMCALMVLRKDIVRCSPKHRYVEICVYSLAKI